MKFKGFNKAEYLKLINAEIKYAETPRITPARSTSHHSTHTLTPRNHQEIIKEMIKY